MIYFLPLRDDRSMALAPSMPISSSVVNTHSSGGCGRSLWSTASAMAQPMQLSAPREVLSAQIHSPSVTISTGSDARSFVQSAVLTHTMSMWPCSMTGSESS